MKYNLVFYVFIVIVISFIIQSCKESAAIDEKKFIKVYADMVFMQDTSSLSQSEIKEKMLQKFNINEADYNTTIQYYNNDPVRWEKFFDSTIAYVESLKPTPKSPPKPQVKVDEKSLQERSLSWDKKNR